MIDCIDLDVDFYRKKYDDLNGFNDKKLLQHYSRYGYYEGRECNSYCLREKLSELCNDKGVLEIGPFTTPQLKGDAVSYADVLDRDGLIKRAGDIGFSTQDIPIIDYVIDNVSLSKITRKFECVFSSHNIEHQPDLISHLEEVYNLLSDKGKYYLVIPHCSFCFDATLPPTKISEIFNAYYERRKVHTVGSVIEHWAMTTHNDPVEHWKRDQNTNDYKWVDSARIKDAIDKYEKNNGDYIDVHAWQFTPISFFNIIKSLIDLDFIRFSNVYVSGQVKNRFEFTAIIEK